MPKRESGSYKKQVSGYSAFVPNDLPVVPRIEIDGELQRLLSRADRALGRLDGAVAALPNPDLFVLMYVRKEATLSSQIEGTQASLNDVLKAEADIADPERPDDVGETINYIGALNHGLERLETLPLSLRLLREIHAKLLHDVRGHEKSPGEFRVTQNWIGPQGVVLNDATFVPPPPETVLHHLSNLEAYIHSDDDLPFLLKVGVAHGQFETIHPFLDGNGRLGRLLITFMLCEREVLVKPVLYLSHFFKQNRSAYYRLLQSIRDEGDWESWLKFFLLAVTTVANEATEVSRRIVELRERHRGLLLADSATGAGNSLKLLEELYRQPFFTAQTVQTFLGVSQPGAKNIVDRMLRLEIAEEISGNKRNRVFRYSSYLELFE